MAQYDNGPGIVTFNATLKDNAVWKTLPNVVIAGITFNGPLRDGLPDATSIDIAQEIANKLLTFMKKRGAIKEAGYFTNGGERLGYYYVNDTTGLRQAISSFYKENYNDYKYYVNIKPDKDGESYLNFLYPNEITREYMKNHAVLETAVENGDNLEKPRRVDHWLYFKSSADRDRFVTFAEREKFKVEGKTANIKRPLPFGLQLSSVSKIDIETISAITLMLRKEAVKYDGDYDGWETSPAK